MREQEIGIYPKADHQHDRGKFHERPRIPFGQTFPLHLVCHDVLPSIGTMWSFLPIDIGILGRAYDSS
jgi:hypothetical protein